MYVSTADVVVVFVIVVLIGFVAFMTGGNVGLMAQDNEVRKLEQECKYLRSLADEDKDAWIKKYEEQKMRAYADAIRKNKTLLTITTFNPDGSFADYDIASVEWLSSPDDKGFVKFTASEFSPENGKVFDLNEIWPKK